MAIAPAAAIRATLDTGMAVSAKLLIGLMFRKSDFCLHDAHLKFAS
jgi:hypothetical protein